MLPIWGRSCALITGLSLGKGLDAGVGAAFFEDFARTLTGTPSYLGALYLFSLPQWKKSVDGGGVHGLGWLPWSLWKGSVGYAGLLLALGAKGTKVALVVFCLEATPPKSRWEESRGRN